MARASGARNAVRVMKVGNCAFTRAIAARMGSVLLQSAVQTVARSGNSVSELRRPFSPGVFERWRSN